jgi:hypothetical protein
MRTTFCRHFRSLVLSPNECGAHVDVRKLVGGDDFGWFKRTPCNAENHIDTCDKRDFPTAAEVAEYDGRMEKRFENMSVAIAEINKRHRNTPQWEEPEQGKNKDASGTIKCPQCGGVLHYTVAGFNGHIWGKCETADCLSWMM